MNLILYGPPGVGKSTLGQLVAKRLQRQFIDLDDWLVAQWGRAVPDYFPADEALFRAREAEACQRLAHMDNLVIAPGGGALLNPHSRAALEASGVIVMLTATLDTLLERLGTSYTRPLLGESPREKLAPLLEKRAPLYASFQVRLKTDQCELDSLVDDLTALEAYHARHVRFTLPDSTAFMGTGLLSKLPQWFETQKIGKPYLAFADESIAPLYGQSVAQTLNTALVTFPAGEDYKNLDTMRALYSASAKHGMDRNGTFISIGGGVAGDMVGFVAATFMRGVKWANIPTTLLAMVDASLGGKTGIDIPEGKNLVGAFHPPAFILADYNVLTTLPEIEKRCGMAEIIKAAIIADKDLFHLIAENAKGAENAEKNKNYAWLIPRAAAVKVGIVNADPFERAERAKLNLGHTIGHGIESASEFRLKHGEAIAIGTVAETRLAEELTLAPKGLAEEIAQCLRAVGLPTHAPGLPTDKIRTLMSTDKKKSGGKLKFALPKQIGEVVFGVDVEESLLMHVLAETVQI